MAPSTTETDFTDEEITIRPMEEVPRSVRGTNRELNMVDYDRNRVHLARRGEDILGAIRSALRVDDRRRHGFLGDLQIEEENRHRGLEERLIRAGERRLFEEEGVRRIDAVMEDGEGWTQYFFRCGFWSSRKTVDMAWNLAELAPMEVPDPEGVTLEATRRPNLDELADFILRSYQPYWRFWKEYKEDMRWIRVEYGEDLEPPESEDLRREMRRRVHDRLEGFNANHDQIMYLAREKTEGNIVAACDALDQPDGDTFEWGMMAEYNYGVKNLGTALVGRALNWLHERDHEVARIKTTSGLDDYDPTVYLYTVSGGAQIVGEYVNCTKLASGERPE